MKHSESKKPSFLSPLSFGLDLLLAVREGISLYMPPLH